MTIAHYLRASSKRHRLFAIGSTELRNEITHTCGDYVQWVAPSDAETVIVSRDPALDNAMLDCLASGGDMRVIATCRDQYFPNYNSIEMGPGPTIDRVEKALGRTAYVLGKPNPYVLTAVMGIPASEMSSTLIIGDSIEQDIALSQNAGAVSALLTSTSPTKITNTSSISSPKPDYIIQAIDELLTLLPESV